MESALHQGGRDPALCLIETFSGLAPPARIARHLARMERGAALLGWPHDARGAQEALGDAPGRPLRLRLTRTAAGGFDLTVAPLPPVPALWHVAVAAPLLDPADPWLRLKSSRRAIHDAARAALPAGLDEAILLNTRGEVCEGTITTLFFDRGAGLRTPPLSSGLLPGILREEMIAAGTLREEVLSARDLPQVRIWLGNSLRGLVPATLQPPARAP